VQNRRANNFDAVRLFAATMVLFGHGYGPFYDKNVELFASYAKYQTSAGLGVNIFFVISGYLVTRSRMFVNDGRTFLQNRLLRLLPGIAVCTLLTGLVIGPLYTTLPLREFFSTKETWAYFLSMFIFPLNDKLPNTFYNCLEGPSIIGVFYTLTLECLCYLFLLFFGVSKRFLRLALWVGLTVLFGLIMRANYAYGDTISWTQNGITLFYFPMKLGTITLAYFALGALGLSLPVELLQNRYAAICAATLYILSFGTSYYEAVEFLTVPYIVLFIGLKDWGTEPIVAKLGDLSYGIYLYHFAIQKSVWSTLHGKCSGTLMLLLSASIVFALAWLSYRFVEKPVLRFKRRSSRPIDEMEGTGNPMTTAPAENKLYSRALDAPSLS
jgi:peptidoglycan/LPS O-acetylase OafA/YrhL